MNHELKNIADQLLLIQGTDISIYDDSFMLKLVEQRVLATESGSINKYSGYLKQNKDESGLLIQSLTVNYSAFFRNPFTYSYLEQVILPTLIELKLAANETEIRIWTAACASGQEAYSLAILCSEVLERINSTMSCRIFATDINENEIVKAKKGVYSLSELNNVTLKRVHDYFSVKDDMYTFSPKLKEHVDFSVFDLLAENNGCPQSSIYGSFDLVVCSNLLYYYQPEYQKQILQKASECLCPNRYLMVSETEREIVKDINYREVFTNSSIFQKI